MNPWKQALRDGMVSGALASVLSTAALAWAGRRENRDAAVPVNAISHWFWGDPALRRAGTSWRYTALGYLVHHGASLFWATLHARALAAIPEPQRRPATIAATATAASAMACVVDYRLTPHRLTPGFQHRLSRPAMALVYGCFGAGLALGALACSRRR